MPLHNPDGLTERILLFGSIGTGKTTSYLKIAQWLQNTGSKNKVYVIDTDFALKRMLTKNLKYKSLKNLTYYECTQWDITEDNDEFKKLPKDEQERKLNKSVVKVTRKILDVIEPDDWLVVDFSDSTWSMVQSWFTERVYQMRIEDHFLLMRLEIQKTLGEGEKPKQSTVFSGRGDWPTINKIYFGWRDTVLFQHKFNVLLTAKENDIEKDDEARTKKMFRRLGVKPAGQKDMAHQTHTVLYTDKDRDDWIITTVKDREVEYLDEEPVKDFVLGYLVKIAGWKLK
jgi:hypothetical protein